MLNTSNIYRRSCSVRTMSIFDHFPISSMSFFVRCRSKEKGNLYKKISNISLFDLLESMLQVIDQLYQENSRLNRNTVIAYVDLVLLQYLPNFVVSNLISQWSISDFIQSNRFLPDQRKNFFSINENISSPSVSCSRPRWKFSLMIVKNILKQTKTVMIMKIVKHTGPRTPSAFNNWPVSNFINVTSNNIWAVDNKSEHDHIFDTNNK